MKRNRLVSRGSRWGGVATCRCAAGSRARPGVPGTTSCCPPAAADSRRSLWRRSRSAWPRPPPSAPTLGRGRSHIRSGTSTHWFRPSEVPVPVTAAHVIRSRRSRWSLRSAVTSQPPQERPSDWLTAYSGKRDDSQSESSSGEPSRTACTW